MESYKARNNSIRFRIYGEGPALVLFHPSPNSSQMMHDFATQLSKSFMVICPDTPGYGISPKLPIANPSMVDYAAAFRALFEELGLESVALYGTATGSQIAIRYGIEYPEHVSHLFLDNCAHFTSGERQKILENYFPNLTPSLDGEHLVKLWDMVSGLFNYFPWCFKEEAYKLNGPMPPPAVLQSIVLDYLKAGADYDIAYRAAFDHEKVEFVQSLKVPTTIFRWEGSILKKYTDRIFDYDLPKNVAGKSIAADRSLRFQEMTSHIEEQYKSSVSYSESAITNDLNRVATINENSTFPGPIPQATADGVYLIKAWHELRDQAILSRKDIDGNENLDAKNIQSQLINWFSSH